MSVVRWVFDYGGSSHYSFPRNPDRFGGDTSWQYEPKLSVVSLVGASVPAIQIDGFTVRRVLRFTAITGVMMRRLQIFYHRSTVIASCRDHLYGTTNAFSCFIISFIPTLHPTIGTVPGSSEDTYDLEMTIIKMG